MFKDTFKRAAVAGGGQDKESSDKPSADKSSKSSQYLLWRLNKRHSVTTK
jgi:hypothetical protein